MIVSVRDKQIALIMAGEVPKRFPPDLLRAAQKAVRALMAAEQIENLRLPPSNRLEALWHLARHDQSNALVLNRNNHPTSVSSHDTSVNPSRITA